MQKNILLNLIAGVFVVASGLISIPAHAQNNQSDVTGNNVFNNPVPPNNRSVSFQGNRISQETVAQAQQLLQKSLDAYRSCSAGGGCVELNNWMQESNEFLSNLNQEVEVFENIQDNQAW